MKSGQRSSLLWRALLAILLTIGFYALAIGIAFGLLFLVYAEIFIIERINVRLTALAVFGAGIILWAIFPRIDKFIAPGPRLTHSKFPELFKQIEAIALATKQAMPREVYLLSEVNAFVAELGGFLGMGTRRVMGIGLPLLHLLTIDELCAVLAHEFGHYDGGDTALGPWIYKTREAIIRTAMGVGQASSLLQIPFTAYAKMFLRITNAISRQQEFTADKLSAQVVGREVAISGLQKVHRYGMAFQAFFQQEYVPILDSGFRTPMMPGFDQFIRSRQVADTIQKSFDEQLHNPTTDPYDTHPSLKERLAELENFPAGKPDRNEPAHVLVDHAQNLEIEILYAMAKDKAQVKALQAINWEEAVEKAYAPQWGKTAETFSSTLNGLTLSTLPDVLTDHTFFAKIATAGKILPPNVTASQVTKEQQNQIISNVIGVAIAHALNREGWKLETSPGEDIVAVKGEHELRPFTIYLQLASNKLTAEEWQQTCEKLGIAGIKLSTN